MVLSLPTVIPCILCAAAYLIFVVRPCPPIPITMCVELPRYSSPGRQGRFSGRSGGDPREQGPPCISACTGVLRESLHCSYSLVSSILVSQ